MDTIITMLLGLAIPAGMTFLFAMVKKGQFENWGISIGKWSSKFGRTRLGKVAWEKMEDLIFMSIVSFAQGLKKGADMDDNNGNGKKEGE